MSLVIKHTKTIGLTGQNYSGKSLVCDYFKKNYNIPTFDGDIAFKYLINHDDEVKKKIKECFGNICFMGKYINSTYFDRPKKMIRLIEIVEESVFSKFYKWKRKQKSDYVIFKCTILHGIFNPVNFNKTISVYCPKKISIWCKDIKEKNNHGCDDISDIVEYPFDYLEKNSDYLVINDLNGMTLPTQIKEIASNLNLKK